MRIADQTLMTGILTDLDQGRQALLRTQGALSSGREVQRASDDPARAVDAMTARSALAWNAQYQRNVDSGVSWLQATEASLAQSVDLMQRARQLLVQAANGVTGGVDQASIAQELGQITEGLVAAGNAQLDGRYLFAGSSTQTAPLVPAGSPPTAATYAGDTAALNREIGPGITQPVNLTADQVFSGGSGLLPALIQARSDVLAGDGSAITADLQTIDAAMDNLVTMRTEVGARLGRLQIADTALKSLDLTLTRQLSAAEDADMAWAATRYASLNTAYQAALQAAGRLLPASLIDFLR